MDGNGMLLLISFIILMGCLVYMIILSNEMSKIIDRLLGRTKRNNPVKMPSKQVALAMAKAVVLTQAKNLNSG